MPRTLAELKWDLHDLLEELREETEKPIITPEMVTNVIKIVDDIKKVQKQIEKKNARKP